MSEPKKMIYIPSLSAGAYQSPIKKNQEMGGGISYRYWDDSQPEQWRYKYMLLTAGHLYKKKQERKDWDLEDSFVFADSGGFQIASGE